jgi:hypothetical protein
MLKTISNKRKIDRTTFITNARRDLELWSLSMHELTNRWVRNQKGMRETVEKTYNHGTRCCLLARRGRRTEISWLQLLFPRVFLRSLFSTHTQTRRAKAEEEEEHLLLRPPLRSQQRSRGQGTQGNKCAHGEEGSQGGVPSEVPRGKGLKEASLSEVSGTYRGTGEWAKPLTIVSGVPHIGSH